MNVPRPSNYTPFFSKANIFQTLWAIDKIKGKKKAIVELLATRPTNTTKNLPFPSKSITTRHLAKHQIIPSF
jgi:hypothetical protein